MRIERITLLLLAFISTAMIFSSYAAAQSLFDNSESLAQSAETQAAEFFNGCVKAPVIPTYEETDLAFCACAAANMQVWLETPLTQRTDREFFESINVRELDAETYLTKIYGPCLHIPVYDLRYDECMTDRTDLRFTRHPRFFKAMCTCMAEGDSDYFKEFAAPFLEMKFAEGDGDKITDPIREVRNDINYHSAFHRIDQRCYRRYANKLSEHMKQQRDRR